VGSESAPTFGLLDPVYVEGFVEGFLERIGEVDPEEVMLFRDPGEGETEKMVLGVLFRVARSAPNSFQDRLWKGGDPERAEVMGVARVGILAQG
jgi:hypothetical protein